MMLRRRSSRPLEGGNKALDLHAALAINPGIADQDTAARLLASASSVRFQALISDLTHSALGRPASVEGKNRPAASVFY